MGCQSKYTRGNLCGMEWVVSQSNLGEALWHQVGCQTKYKWGKLRGIELVVSHSIPGESFVGSSGSSVLPEIKAIGSGIGFKTRFSNSSSSSLLK